MKRTTKILIGATAAAAIAAGAAAEAGEFSFRYNKHELETSYSIERLYNRIVRRANSACLTTGRRGIWQSRAQARCVEAVTADLVGQIADVRLTAVHDQSRTFAAN